MIDNNNKHLLQSDSVSYFFDEIDRIAKPNFIPSQKDILHCRKATKGVYEFTIRIKVHSKSSLIRFSKWNFNGFHLLLFIKCMILNFFAGHSICFCRCRWPENPTTKMDDMFQFGDINFIFGINIGI